MSAQQCRIVVLISGSGSNLQALIDATQNGQISGKIVAVISNRPDVYGLQRAQMADIPTAVLDHTAFDSREDFDQALAKTIDDFMPDVIALAGFMRILSSDFVNHYLGRMLNIHPSRLPKYRGLHTHQRAIDAGDKEHGASVHFVTPELDGGPVIIRSRVKIQPEDDAASLAQSVLKTEHIIYPLTIEWFCDRILTLTNSSVMLKQKPLNVPIELDDVIARSN